MFDTSWGTNNNMGALVLILQAFPLLLDRQTTEEITDTDVLHVSSETLVLMANLEGQFTSVAKHQDGYLTVNGLKLLQSRDDKHCGFTHSRLGLADDIHTQDSLRNTFVLHCTLIRSKAAKG